VLGRERKVGADGCCIVILSGRRKAPSRRTAELVEAR